MTVVATARAISSNSLDGLFPGPPLDGILAESRRKPMTAEDALEGRTRMALAKVGRSKSGPGWVPMWLFLAALLSIPLPATAQEAAISPSSGPPGTTVTVEAFGLQEGDVLALVFGGETLGTGTADVEGVARFSGTIPEVESGGHPMTVVNQESGETLAEQEFVVTPPDEPAASPGGGGGGGGGGGENPGERREGDAPARPREGTAERDGFPWWTVVLVAILLIATGGVFLAGTTGRVVPCRETKRGTRRYDGERIGIRQRPYRHPNTGEDTGMDVITVVRFRLYRIPVQRCILPYGHVTRAHEFEETPSIEEPAPDWYYEPVAQYQVEVHHEYGTRSSWEEYWKGVDDPGDLPWGRPARSKCASCGQPVLWADSLCPSCGASHAAHDGWRWPEPATVR
jgi:hypothetical protein